MPSTGDMAVGNSKTIVCPLELTAEQKETDHVRWDSREGNRVELRM